MESDHWLRQSSTIQVSVGKGSESGCACAPNANSMTKKRGRTCPSLWASYNKEKQNSEKRVVFSIHVLSREAEFVTFYAT